MKVRHVILGLPEVGLHKDELHLVRAVGSEVVNGEMVIYFELVDQSRRAEDKSD